MKIKIPDKIILLGEIYDVRFEEVSDDDRGEIVYEEKIIRLSPKLKDDPEELEYVFFHELGHYFGRLVGADEEALASLFGYYVQSILNQTQLEDKENVTEKKA